MRHPTKAACCRDFYVSLKELLFPYHMGLDTFNFIHAHGIDKLSLEELRESLVWVGHDEDVGEDTVIVRHTCQHLQKDGRCAIYAHRPNICKDFDCSTRDDCTCHGTGVA